MIVSNLKRLADRVAYTEQSVSKVGESGSSIQDRLKGGIVCVEVGKLK